MSLYDGKSGKRLGRGEKTPLHRIFYHQMKNAERRGVPFRLTFDQWLAIWKQSGHSPGGQSNADYCMARHGDKGAYEIGNVSIITCEENNRTKRHTESAKVAISEAMKNRVMTPTHKKRIGAALKGRVFSVETRARMSASARNRKRK